MTGLHSPWSLFGDDLEMARSWLRPQLQGLVSMRTGHLAISLGLGDALLDALREGRIQADANAMHQWNFRVARLHGEANPYLYLLPEGLLEHTLNAITRSRTSGDPLCVELNGGIGDHLEALSLLLPWAKEQNCCLNLVMGAKRQQQIEPLLPKGDGVRCNQTCNQGTTLIPVMAFRGALAVNTALMRYRTWLMQKRATHQPMTPQWLFCWRAEGAGDKMSAHTRSVPWALVQAFYRHLQRLYPQCCLVDITDWKDWEASQLRGIGVEILDPRQGTLLDLAERCRHSRVVTIDTALVHLCAAAGQRADLLLSAFPDERWQELHRQEHHYGQLITIRRSSQFGSWSELLTSLTLSMTAEGLSTGKETLSPRRQ